MSIKDFSFSEIKEKAEKLAEIWEKFYLEWPDDPLLEQNEFAPLIATICNERGFHGYAFEFPSWLNDRIGGFDLPRLLKVDYKEMLRKFFEDKCSSRMKDKEGQDGYINKISEDILDALRFFQKEGKSPVTMFENRPYTALEVYFTLRRIAGIGPKKASMTTKDFIYRSLGLSKCHPWFDQVKAKSPEFDVKEGNLADMPIDVNVIKVFNRIFGRMFPGEEGWRGELPNHIHDILAFSKLAFPDLPVKLDDIFWVVGRDYCYDIDPDCEECPIAKICESAKKFYA
ncbi:MAG: hypothetical protein QW743_08385 [Candidatus Methanomethylicia archaeon]